jgi:Resolvase, N terminal domain
MPRVFRSTVSGECDNARTRNQDPRAGWASFILSATSSSLTPRQSPKRELTVTVCSTNATTTNTGRNSPAVGMSLMPNMRNTLADVCRTTKRAAVHAPRRQMHLEQEGVCQQDSGGDEPSSRRDQNRHGQPLSLSPLLAAQERQTIKIAIYARVSTEKQETENQLLKLREFASKLDWQIFLEYVDY